MPQPFLFTLVQGTGPTRWALWVRPDSTFSEQLRAAARAEGHVADIEMFAWSGSNSQRGRLRAAEALARHVLHCAATYPTHRHVVIGHSHGGTVALLAFSKLTSYVSDIVCLSTPVIHSRDRPNRMHLFDSFCNGGVLWLSSVVFILLFARLELALFAPSFWRQVFFLWIVSTLVWGALYWPTNWLKDRARLVMLRSSFDWESSEAPSSLLILRCAGDEASAGLGAIRLAQWAAMKAGTVINVGLGHVISSAMFVASLVLGGALWIDLFVLLANDAYWPFVGTIFLAAAVAAICVRDRVAFVLGLLMVSVSFFFSLDAPLAIFDRELSVEETPPGQWVVHQLSFIEESGPHSFFEHSKIYRDSRTASLIVTWLLSRSRGSCSR